MIRLFYSFMLLFVLGCETSQNHSLMLWEITSKEMSQPSYLFGTFHTKDSTMNALPRKLTATLKRSHRLYTEILLTQKSTKEIQLFSKMKSPAPLKKRLTPKNIKTISNYLRKHRSNYTLKSLEPYKTWAIALIVSNEQDISEAQFMDETLVTYAKRHRIKQAGLETPKEQLHYLDKLSPSMQEQFLLDTLLQQENIPYAKALETWYINGDPKDFLQIQERYTSRDPKQKQLDTILNKGLLSERNKRFSRRIDILLKHNSDLRYFFAIGAGHLSGDESVLSQLQKKGYHIRKLD